MAFTLSSTYQKLEGLRLISPGQPIRSSQLRAYADNAHHAYAYGARRTVLTIDSADMSGLATTYHLVARVPFAFACGREARGLQLVYQVTNCDVQVVIRDAGDTMDLASFTDASGSGVHTEEVGPSADASVLVLVYAREHTAATATLDLMQVYEHSADTFPNIAAG